MSTNLLRVHDELSKVARVHAGGDDSIPTEIPASAVAATGSARARVEDLSQAA